MPPCSVNHTFDAVVSEVPMPSLLAGVHRGISPGPPGAVCPGSPAGAASATESTSKVRRVIPARLSLVSVQGSDRRRATPGRCGDERFGVEPKMVTALHE